MFAAKKASITFNVSSAGSYNNFSSGVKNRIRVNLENPNPNCNSNIAIRVNYFENPLALQTLYTFRFFKSSVKIRVNEVKIIRILTYKCSVVVAFSSKGMAEPNISKKIIGIQHKSSNSILHAKMGFRK